MAVDRIAAFAESMTPALADLAGQSIARTRKVQAKERQAVINAMFEAFKVRERDTAIRLGEQLFLPLTPWSAESACMAARLLYFAFFAALERPAAWDRRLSTATITHRIKTRMNLHIGQWARDRGIYGKMSDPADIGFEGITLEGSHK